ncbi:hypothetical protein [Microbacterium elymi]|uniref:Uncharacterized protein n=1 Tax=Microbacterium elymi TaxID=2909587 RepID=A0ABY5NK06_9MICO|nr:hypothetical protein [Microbacterium elymi]UUT35511.1 hypothetical protein L2X98_19325 [Microbacterium elymi]
MQIVLALIYGAAIGALAHFTMPARDMRGSALAPMLGAVVGGAVWTILTWVGLGLDSPWLWLAALIVPAAVVYIAVAVLTRLRRARDERERERLRLA